MNLKNVSKFILIIILFTTHQQSFATTADTKNESTMQIVDEYFKKFCENTPSDHIKYFDKTNEFVLFAHPSALNDFFNALIATGILGVGGVFAFPAAFKRYDGNTLFPGANANIEMILGLISGGFLVCATTMWYKIIRNYRLRNGAVPYLTFDSKGLKKFDEYVFEWQNIKKVDLLIRQTVDQYYRILEETYVASFVDKFGDILLKITSEDPLLPTSYEQLRKICNHLADRVGNRKLK